MPEETFVVEIDLTASGTDGRDDPKKFIEVAAKRHC